MSCPRWKSCLACVAFGCLAAVAFAPSAIAEPGTSDAGIAAGLSENAWDFDAPDGVPGFGPMRPTDDARAMAIQILDGGRTAADRLVTSSIRAAPAPGSARASEARTGADGRSPGSR